MHNFYEKMFIVWKLARKHLTPFTLFMRVVCITYKKLIECVINGYRVSFFACNSQKEEINTEFAVLLFYIVFKNYFNKSIFFKDQPPYEISESYKK